MKTAKNHMPTKPKTRQRVSQGVRLWALKIALLALAIQVLMPISMAFATNNTASDRTLAFCTQFGIQLQSIDKDGNPVGSPTAKATWDCPICQLQIGADTPKVQIFAFALSSLEKSNVATVPDNMAVYKYYKDPNSPRAPPAA